MPHLSVKSTSQDCACWFLWFLLRRPKHSSPLPFLNFLSTSSGMRIKRSHVVSFLSFVTSRCQTDVLAGTWWTKSKISNGDNLNMRWEIRFSYQESKQMGGRRTSVTTYQPPRWFARWHDLKWSLRLPPQFMTQNIKHVQKPQTSCSTCTLRQYHHASTLELTAVIYPNTFDLTAS